MKLGQGFTLLVGGARSGKSDLAVGLGTAWAGTVTFVATAEAGDEDMARRIARHREDRPDSWELVEAPAFSASDLLVIDADALVIVDCITMLTTNLLLAESPEAEIEASLAQLAEAAASRSAPTLMISNEVGLGVHPPTEIGRQFRDLLGRINKQLAASATDALLIVAGRALPLEQVDVTW